MITTIGVCLLCNNPTDLLLCQTCTYDLIDKRNKKQAERLNKQQAEQAEQKFLEDNGFLGTYLTEDGSTAIVFQKAKDAGKVIWIGYMILRVKLGGMLDTSFTANIWDSRGHSFIHNPEWNLKEAVREKAT